MGRTAHTRWESASSVSQAIPDGQYSQTNLGANLKFVKCFFFSEDGSGNKFVVELTGAPEDSDGYLDSAIFVEGIENVLFNLEKVGSAWMFKVTNNSGETLKTAMKFDRVIA